MEASAMLDKVTQIIARTDVDRTLSLFFMNTARRAVLREHNIRKFYSYKTMVHASGIISDLTIKHAKTVEYVDGTTVVTLARLRSFDDARKEYPNLTATGTPAHYLEMGTEIWILPVPTIGTIKIYGEFWPADLTDSTSSTDVTTVEIPEALIYLTAAEYFDFFDEPDKWTKWFKKGEAIVNEYVKQDKKLATYKVGLTNDPLGNGGI